MPITVPVKIDGIDITISTIAKICAAVNDDEGASGEFKEGATAVCDIITKALTKLTEEMKGKRKTMEIKIKYHNGMEEWPIEKFEKGDFIDLRAAETIELMPMEFRLISLGVSMQLPEGYHAELVPRSSTFKKYKILQTNSIGIIDNSYCGDNDIWKLPALAVSHTVITKGDRIAQFRIVKNSEPVRFEKVDTLGNEDRGGFGSSGTR